MPPIRSLALALLLLAISPPPAEALPQTATLLAVPAGLHEVLLIWSPEAGPATYQVFGQLDSTSTPTFLLETSDPRAVVPDTYETYAVHVVVDGAVVRVLETDYCVGLVGTPPRVEVHECSHAARRSSRQL